MTSQLQQWFKTGIKFHKEYLSILVLCYFAFRIVSITGGDSFTNAILIMELEYVVIVLYLLILREFPPFLRIIKENRMVSFLLFLWLLSVTYSFLSWPLAPLQKSAEYYVQQRYFQTITHVIFFIFIWDLFNRYRPPLKWLVYTIAASSLFVVGYFLKDWMSGAYPVGDIWPSHPPLNSNKNHTGYQLEAAIAFFLSMVIFNVAINLKSTIKILVWVILWAFLFWLGGRGAALSLIGAMFFVWAALYFKKLNSKQFAFLIIFVLAIAIVISEWLSVFPWSGILYRMSLVVQADSIREASYDRIDIWEATWESVKNNIFFGLGPQGYRLMTYHDQGVQPHNVFMQFLVEWGVVGTGLFLYLLTRTFIKGFKLHVLNGRETYNIFVISAGAVILSLSAHALIDGTYYHPQPSVYLAIAFAIWIVPWHQERENE